MSCRGKSKGEETRQQIVERTRHERELRRQQKLESKSATIISVSVTIVIDMHDQSKSSAAEKRREEQSEGQDVPEYWVRVHTSRQSPNVLSVLSVCMQCLKKYHVRF